MMCPYKEGQADMQGGLRVHVKAKVGVRALQAEEPRELEPRELRGWTYCVASGATCRRLGFKAPALTAGQPASVV